MKTMQLIINKQSRELSVKEFKNQRVVTFKDIDELHQRAEGTARRNFTQHKNRLIEGEDYFVLKPNDSDVRNSYIRNYLNNAGTTLFTESGYLMLVKSFQDDLAWEVQRTLVNTYFRAKESVDPNQLSPELQMFQKMFNALANQEIEAQRLQKEIETTNQRVDNISEIVGLNPTEWRRKVNKILKSIAMKLGGYDSFQEVRNNSYTLLEERGKCSLSTRLTNKQRKMALEGTSKSKINKVNRMDVIAEDQRLTEIYLAIVKELAIKYQVEVNEGLLT
jgi:ORF6N domain